jgi:hypothetical protein
MLDATATETTHVNAVRPPMSQPDHPRVAVGKVGILPVSYTHLTLPTTPYV